MTSAVPVSLSRHLVPASAAALAFSLMLGCVSALQPYTYQNIPSNPSDFPDNTIAIWPSDGGPFCGPQKGGYFHPSPDHCQAKCDADEHCAGFMQYASDTCCYLKGRMSFQVVNSRAYAYKKFGYPGPYEVRYTNDVPGNDIAPPAGAPINAAVCGSSATQESLADCVSRSDNSSAAIAFVHNSFNNCCFLKSAKSREVENVDTAIYTKIFCPAGFAPTPGYSSCTYCAAGHAGGGCSLCGPGTYSAGGSPSSTGCQKCADATVAPTSGSTSCQPCPAGTNPNLDKSACVGPPSQAFSPKAIFSEVQQINSALLGYLAAGNLTGALQYLAPDVQLVVFNPTAPSTPVSNATMVASTFASVAFPANSSNVTYSARIFRVQDPYTVDFVDEFNVGRPGVNYFYTAAWQKAGPGKWVMKAASLAPASNTTVVTRTTPIIFVTPNQTVNSSLTPYNGTLPPNFTTQPNVSSTAGQLFTALANQNLSLVNVSNQFFGPNFYLVVPGVDGPIPLNYSNPGFVNFMTSLRNRNATSPSPTTVSYVQLSPTAAILTTLIRQVSTFGNVYVLQLWEYLGIATGNATTNTTAGGTGWLLSLASVNIAPTG